MSSFQVSKFTLEQILRSEKKILDLQEELKSSMGFLFKALDVSKKGSLTFTDFHSYIVLKSYPFSLEDSRLIFSVLDKKSKGSITFSDFCSQFSDKCANNTCKNGYEPTYSPITELKFYLLMREWLSSLKYKQDLASNPDIFKELDPENIGFINISSFSKLTDVQNPGLIARCFGFKSDDKISKSEFLENLRKHPSSEAIVHKKGSSSLSKIHSKDLRDLEYTNYLEKYNDLKSMRGNSTSRVFFSEKEPLTTRNYHEKNEYKEKTNDILKKSLNFIYGFKKMEQNNDGLFCTEKKLYTPRTLRSNGQTVQKNNSLNKLFSSSKEYSKSVYESFEKEDTRRNLLTRNFNKNENGWSSSKKESQVKDDIEKMMKMVENVKISSEHRKNNDDSNQVKEFILESQDNEKHMLENMTKIVENIKNSLIENKNDKFNKDDEMNKNINAIDLIEKNGKNDKNNSEIRQDEEKSNIPTNNEKLHKKETNEVKENNENKKNDEISHENQEINNKEKNPDKYIINVNTENNGLNRNKSQSEPFSNTQPLITKELSEIQSNYLKDEITTNSIIIDDDPSKPQKKKSENQFFKAPESLQLERKSSAAVYESLFFSLEEMYLQVKRKILIYQQPIIYLMISSSNNSEPSEESLERFFKRSLLEIFDIKSFAIYSDNRMKTPYKDELDLYERLKLESLLMDSFSIGAVAEHLEKKGVFFQKLGENKDDGVIIYTINDPNEDNIMYSYFQLVEKYNFMGFKEHLTKYILLIDSIILNKKAVEIGFIVKELLNLIEYFIVNFKVLFLEHIKKVLSKSFDLEIVVNLAIPQEKSRNKKLKTSRLSCFKDLLDQNNDPNELSLTVPNENCSFAIKFKAQGQNKNYFAIIYEQAMDIFQQLRSLVNSHSERLLFYEHFLESNNINSLLLDFDKKSRLIFQSQPFNKNLGEFLNINFKKKSLIDLNELEFCDLFDQKHEIYSFTMKNLLNNIRLKNMKEFLVNKMNYLGCDKEKSPLLQDNLTKKIKVITRAKSKNFKGFYILVQIDKPKEEDEEYEEEEEDAIEVKNDTILQNWSSETKLIRKMKTLQTSAMVQRSLIMKSATMRNSILLDYVDEGFKNLMNLEKKESLPIGKTSFDSSTDAKSSEEIKIKKKKLIYQPASRPKPEIFSLEAELMSQDKFKDLESLDFSVLDLDVKGLFQLAWRLMNKFDFFGKYSVHPDTWLEFIWRMERKYNKRDNPFHNFYHGLTVMHGCYCLSSLPSLRTLIPEFDQLILIFSGLCHDVSHTAHNNAFEMNSFSKLCIRYNDKSVLENHHLTTTFKILQLPQCNIFEKMDRFDFLYLRKGMINNILSTDMKEHFTILHNFEVKLKETNFQSEKMMQSEGDKLAVYGMLIHCCDFFGNIKPFEISKDWSNRVNKEFSQQYLDEGKLGLPQTPYYKDLDHRDTLIRNEINFTKVIIQPLWNVLNQFLQNEVDVCINNSVTNLVCWERHLEEAEKQTRNFQKASWIEPIKEEEQKQEKTEKTVENDVEPMIGRNLEDLSSDEDEENSENEEKK